MTTPKTEDRKIITFLPVKYVRRANMYLVVEKIAWDKLSLKQHWFISQQEANNFYEEKTK